MRYIEWDAWKRINMNFHFHTRIIIKCRGMCKCHSMNIDGADFLFLFFCFAIQKPIFAMLE